MRENKQRDMTPYAMPREPERPNPLLLPLIWLACRCATWKGWLRVRRIGMKGLEPPFLVLAEHQGFTDYYIAPLALFPRRASYLSDVEGFANYGKGLYGALGCVPVRRFAYNPTLIPSLRHVVEKNKDILVLFPEARHSNVGTNSLLPASVGKLVRLLNLPVVLMKSHGSYLTSPIWDEKHKRKVPLTTMLELILTPEKIQSLTDGEITELLNKRFEYDEYRWQEQNRIAIRTPTRAEGLHKVLYQCPACKGEHHMTSSGDTLRCRNCEKTWEMDEYGQLSSTKSPTEYPHIPDWYEFQRQQVLRQIRDNRYHLHISVKVEALPNEKGFVPLGTGTLRHTPEGFSLAIPQSELQLRFSSKAMPSIHTEYDYRGKGDCLVLSTAECCYYLYPLTTRVNITKIQFAAEEFYRRSHSAE